jgi:hypothetical protein
VALHQWQCDQQETLEHIQEMAQSRMAIESMTSIMVETVREFLPRIYAGWSKSRHPQGIQSVFTAALALIHSQATRTDQTGLKELKEMLNIQSRRWQIAGKELTFQIIIRHQLNSPKLNMLKLSKKRKLVYANLNFIHNDGTILNLNSPGLHCCQNSKVHDDCQYIKAKDS